MGQRVIESADATTLIGDTHAVDKMHRLSPSEINPHESEQLPSDFTRRDLFAPYCLMVKTVAHIVRQKVDATPRWRQIVHLVHLWRERT